MAEKEEQPYNFSDFSDSDDDAVGLKNTIAAIRKLDNHKQVLPAERSEPSLKVDEFHLIKEGDDGSAVKLSELTRTLNKKFKDSDLLRELRGAQRQAKTLPKPLEKPEAEKIQRTAGFEKVKTQLTHWEPVVQQSRVADHQVFPLPQPGETFTTKEDFVNTIVPETDLEKRMAEILKKNNPNPEQEDGSTIFQLTLEEMIERRKEAAKLRAQQSYIVAKARRQNKIKSKTYHRIARRERIRQQMKEFETLQQTNPEEALKRIEELEKERALERVTLRHRNTGKWARNQAVRAKYNKESREVLSEQLKLSRDLTKKVAMDSETSEEEEEDEEQNTASDNPWVNTKKTEAEIDNFISGYRKFWDGKEKSGDTAKEEADEAVAKKAEEDALNARAQYLLKSAVVAATASVLEQKDADEDTAGSDKRINGESESESEEASTSKKSEDKSSKKTPATRENIKQKVTPKKTSVTKLDTGKKQSKKISAESNLKEVNLSNARIKPSASNVSENKSSKKNPTTPKDAQQRVTAKQTPAKKANIEQKQSKNVAEKKRVVNDIEKKVTVSPSKTEKKNSTLNSPVNIIISRCGKWTVTSKHESNKTSSADERKEKRAGFREINTLFNNMDNNLKRKAEDKIKQLKRAFGDDEPKKKKRKRANTKKKNVNSKETIASSFRDEARQRPDEDAPLDEGSGRHPGSVPTREVPAVANLNIPLEENKSSEALPEIDPSNFMQPVRTTLVATVPDLVANGEEAMDDDDMDRGADQHLTISEAFADDDVVAEFEQEKSEEIDKNKAKDIDLSLPGWGSWGGFNVKPNEKKKKRFIIKAPEPEKRRDENKGHLYINEKQENKLKPQQVTELPFPFKSVKDFEASVGAPISDTFIPQSAHRKLVIPRVITKSGAIIEPLSKDVLTQRRKEKLKKLDERRKESGKDERKTGPRKAPMRKKK